MGDKISKNIIVVIVSFISAIVVTSPSQKSRRNLAGLVITIRLNRL